MSFMERLHSAFILKTHMYHPQEAAIVEHPYQRFHDAIRTGDNDGVIEMIRNGFDVDYHDLARTPPLICAIIHDQPEIIQTLLLYGANPCISNIDKNTPLHFACRLNQVESAHLLMRYGADAEKKNSEGISPLMIADIYEQKRLKQTLMSTPSMHKQTERSLFEYAHDGDLHGLQQSLTGLQELYGTNNEGQSLLHLAVLSGNVKMAVYLLNKQLDIDKSDLNGFTPTILAMSHSSLSKIAQLLLQRHATMDHKSNAGHSALTFALRNNNPEGARLLIENGVNIHTYDGLHTPLTLCHDAIVNFPQNSGEFRELMTLLLVRGAHVDIPTNRLRWTPLFHTTTRNQDPKIKAHLALLVQLGADVNYIDANRRTALMLAASMGRFHVVELLMNNYADPEKLDAFGWSALMLAVYYNHYNVASFLLENGVNVNLTSEQGLNALKIALQHNRSRMVELLLNFGAIAAMDEDR
jgi:ankyrin repeat protein